MVKHLTLLLLIGLAWGYEYESNEINTEEKDILNKHNLSIGMLDDKTGISLIGYTYNVKQTRLDEYFIGVGTMIIAFTGTVGWKHYYKKSRFSISSTFCGQYVAHLGFMGFMPTASLNLEYDLLDWVQIKLGGMGLVLLGGTSSEAGSDIGVLPFAGLSFRF